MNIKNLEELNEKISKCPDCPMSQTGGVPELGWGESDEYFFIGQCPALTNKDGKRGTSNFDKFFLELLDEAGFRKDQFYFTNLVKIPILINYVSEASIEHCGHHVLEELEIIKPKVVITLGQYASNWIRNQNIPHYELKHPGSIRYKGSIARTMWVEELKQIKIKHDKETNITS